MTLPPTLGLILAGGQARRMGGGDKALLRIAGRTILDRVIGRLGPQCDGLVLSANGDPVRFADARLPVLTDDVPDFAGPLAGILAGLDWAAKHRPEIAWMASAAADCPFLPRDLVPRLHAARASAGAALAIAASGGRTHPVSGLWPVAMRHDLRRALQQGRRRAGDWTARHRAARAEWSVDPLDPFFNVNTPADLALAERLGRQVQISEA